LAASIAQRLLGCEENGQKMGIGEESLAERKRKRCIHCTIDGRELVGAKNFAYNWDSNSIAIKHADSF